MLPGSPIVNRDPPVPLTALLGETAWWCKVWVQPTCHRAASAAARALAFFTWKLCQCLTPSAGEPEGFTAAGLPVLTPYPQFSAPNDAVVKIKVIYSKRILGTYFVIKTPQCNENKVLVSLSSVYKEGTISGINFKSPPTVLGAICRRLERSKRRSSFDAMFFLLQACLWASSLGLNETCGALL